MTDSGRLGYIDGVQVALSRLINATLGGDYRETTSARAYREREQRPWGYTLLNWIFFWQQDHCRSTYEWEQESKA